MTDGRPIDGAQIAEDVRAVTDGKADEILHLAVELIHEQGEKYDWVGIYLLNGNHLVLHNYIGKPTDHIRIPVGQGVCGTAVAEDRDINIPDVTEIENYLACSVETRAEIVVLIKDGERTLGQIDIDSDVVGAFDDSDMKELRRVADALGEVLGPKLRHDQ